LAPERDSAKRAAESGRQNGRRELKKKAKVRSKE
jgi:hypothetical protein